MFLAITPSAIRMCQKIIDAFPESNTGSDPEAVIIRQSLSEATLFSWTIWYWS